MPSDQEHIDNLLERYLTLLDEYTRLRKELSQVQVTIFHDIARANFSGERGQRFGQDQYDQRMQATRRLEIGQDGYGTKFSVKKLDDCGDSVEDEKKIKDVGEDVNDDLPSSGRGDDSAPGEQDKAKRKNKDPLRWFGILTPMPLRTAQGHSIKVVEEVIPRLISVVAEMQHVEIEVRRARKRRAKAESKKAVLDTEVEIQTTAA